MQKPVVGVVFNLCKVQIQTMTEIQILALQGMYISSLVLVFIRFVQVVEAYLE